MAQMGFFDLSDRYASLDAKRDPLVEIDAIVPWEEFRPALERVWRKPEGERKSRAGRKPMDAILMFKTLVLSALYNLSDDQIEYQVRDRLSFMRFLGLGLEDRVPDAKTVWLYREGLAQAGLVEELFRQFDGYLDRQGYIARGGQILDASIVAVPKNHNTRDENKTIKSGEVPEDWTDKPAKRSQKDVDARWTKKHGKSHYGYKNHVNVDRKHKLVRRYHVSDAALHDSHTNIATKNAASCKLVSYLDIIRSLARNAIIDDACCRDALYRLRKGGYLFIEVDQDELLTLLMECLVENGNLVESAELKALRESLMLSRQSKYLRVGDEVVWLNSVLIAFILTFRQFWDSDDDPDVIKARANWLLPHCDIRGWLRCFPFE